MTIGGLPYTDAGNARRFIREHREWLRFVPGVGWRAWDGKRWALCKEPMAFAYETIERLNPANHELADYDAREAAKWYRASQAAPAIRNMISLAKDDAAMETLPAEFDAHPHLLNCPNGVLDIPRMQLSPHDSSLYLTKMTGVPYEYDSPEKWHDHVMKVTDNDEELYNYIQAALGYTLSGYTDEQVMFVAHGTGQNGKSLLLNVVRRVMGDYAETADRYLLIKSSANSIGHNLVQLKGARFAMANETGAGNEIDEVAIKQLTGSDAVTGRLLYQNNVTFVPSAKIWLATNHRPKIRTQDLGIWRRIREIPFRVQIPEEDRIKDYDQNIFLGEGSKVLGWMVYGYQLWLATGLEPPAAVVAALEAYKEDQDTAKVGLFLSARCKVWPSGKATNADIWAAYLDWREGLEDDDRPPELTKQGLLDRMCERGMRRARWDAGSTRGLLGVEMASDSAEAN